MHTLQRALFSLINTLEIIFEKHELADEEFDHYDTAMSRVRQEACKAVGHAEIIQDQCGKPEHDYCIGCQEALPGQAHSRKAKA